MNDMFPPHKQDNRRLYLAVALSAVVLFVWQKWFMPKPKPHLGLDGGGIAQVVDAGGAPIAAAGTAPVAAAPAMLPTEPNAPKPPEQLAEFDGPTRHLVFSSYGGALKSAVLKGEQFKREVKGKTEQVDMVQVEPGQPLPFSTALGQGLPPVPADLPYAMTKTSDGVTFTAQQGPLTITKRYTVPANGYDVGLQVEIKNTGGQPLSGDLTVGVDSFVKPGSEDRPTGIMGFLSRGPQNLRLPIARVDKDTHRQQKDKDGKVQDVAGELKFAGIDEQYFLAALYPLGDRHAKVVLSTPADGLRHVDASFAASIAPGATDERSFGLYVGPKLKEALEAAGSTVPALKNAHPELTESVEYGYMAVIAVILLWVMRAFHMLIPNWGVDIILLTLAVKVLTLPLTMKQMMQSEKMKKLQPQMDAIKAKYKGDKEKQNQETMRLYSQSGVNPLSGCLPMLIQLPVFWGLWRLLEYAFDIYRQPFVPGWINDLSAIDPTYVLPVLLIVTMFGSQTMMPAMGDAAQQKMMKYAMPLMFGVFMIGLPAGLSLYYVFNNLLNIIQQLYLRKRFPAMRQTPDSKKKLATS